MPQSREQPPNGALDGALRAIAAVLVDEAGARTAEMVLYVPDPATVLRETIGPPPPSSTGATMVPLLWQERPIGHVALHPPTARVMTAAAKILEGALPLLAARRELEIMRARLARERDILTAVVEALPIGVSIREDVTGEVIASNELYHSGDGAGQGETRRIQTGDLGLTLQIQAPADHHQAVEAATSSAREAIQASRMKTAFLEAMSHELRTPLNAILGLGELLASSELDDSQRHLVETLRTSGGALLKLLNDILDYVRLQGGSLPLRDDEVEVLTMGEEVVATLRPLAQQRGLSLWCTVSADAPLTAITDPHRLQQIVRQLVRRAIRTTTAGDVQVDLTAMQRRDGRAGLRIVVRDTSSGLTRDAEAQLFEPFADGPSYGEDTASDTGLGLAICRELAVAMGGSLTVARTADEGTTLALELPAATDAPTMRALSGTFLLRKAPSRYRDALAQMLLDWGLTEADAAPDSATPPGVVTLVDAAHVGDDASARRMVLADDEGLEPDLPARPLPSALHARLGELLTLRPEVAAPGPPRTISSMRVLIVEDNAVNRLVARRMLTTLGCTVAVAEGGLEAIETVKTEVPDVVLMDCHMPDLDGWQTTRAIRAMGGAAATVPIIAVTASDEQEVRERCYAEGMTGYLAKPISLATLSAALRASATS